ncbi:MAG: hypothetical protein ABI411_05400 [Tahibacter sp.]
MTPFKSTAVAPTFEAYPPVMRRKLLALRELVFRTAASTHGVGEIEETLKWGESAYLTSSSKRGTTVRITWTMKRPAEYALYVHCQTSLIETFRTLFPTEFKFEGNRGIIFSASQSAPTDAVSFCVAAALTYHSRLKPARRSKRRANAP